jgi:hypothetical protein
LREKSQVQTSSPYPRLSPNLSELISSSHPYLPYKKTSFLGPMPLYFFPVCLARAGWALFFATFLGVLRVRPPHPWQLSGAFPLGPHTMSVM